MAKDKTPNAKTKQPAKGKETENLQAKALVELVKGKDDKAAAKAKDAKTPAKAGNPKDAKTPAKAGNAKDAKGKDSKAQKTAAAPAKRQRGFGVFLRRIGRYFKDMFSELKKATWPSRKDLVKYTGVVLAFVTVLAVIIGLLDFGFTELLKLITG